MEKSRRRGIAGDRRIGFGETPPSVRAEVDCPEVKDPCHKKPDSEKKPVHDPQFKAPEKCPCFWFERLLRGREKGELDEEVTVRYVVKQD